METKESKLWAKRITEARDVHKKEVIRWAEKIIKEYAGDFKSDGDTGERYDQVAQVINSVEETIQPHLLLQSPKVIVKANKPEWDRRQNLVEAVVNHEYRDILPNGRRLELENELALLDARLLPYGGTKTVWLVKGSMLDDTPEPGLMDNIKGMFTGEDTPKIEIPVIEEEKGHVTERFDPLKVMIDPNAKHITKIKYVIEELDLEEEEIKSPKYDQALVEKMKPDSTSDSTSQNMDNKQMENYFKTYPDNKRYRVYEIHDLEKRKIHTYSEQLKDFLEYDREPPVDEGSVYSFLYFIEAPNKAYPIPPIKFYRKRALEFSYIYTQVSKQIDKFLPKIGVDSTKLSAAGKERLKAGNLATIIETVGNPAGAITQFNFTIQKELFAYLDMIKSLMNMESGVNDYEMAAPEENLTATEATQISQGTKARRLKPKKRVREFLVGQAHVIWLILAKNQTAEQFIKVLGEKNALEWWTDPETGKQAWTGEDLIGDYAFDIDMDSITPINEAVRKKQNMEGLMTVLRPELNMALQQEGLRLKVSNIFEKFAKDNLGIMDREEILEDLSILKPEQEHDLWMQAQFPPVQPNEDTMEHLQKHSAWIRSPMFQFLPEQIKAQALQHGAQTEQIAMQQQGQQKQSRSGGGPVKPGSPTAGMNLPDNSQPSEVNMNAGGNRP